MAVVVRARHPPGRHAALPIPPRPGPGLLHTQRWTCNSIVPPRRAPRHARRRGRGRRSRGWLRRVVLPPAASPRACAVSPPSAPPASAPPPAAACPPPRPGSGRAAGARCALEGGSGRGGGWARCRWARATMWVRIACWRRVWIAGAFGERARGARGWALRFYRGVQTMPKSAPPSLPFGLPSRFAALCKISLCFPFSHVRLTKL